MNALFYVLRGGCPWRMLPEHFPPHQTAYRWFVRFRDSGLWESLNHRLLMLDREMSGREASPSVAIVDSQIGTMGGIGVHFDIRLEIDAGRLEPFPTLLLLDRPRGGARR